MPSIWSHAAQSQLPSRVVLVGLAAPDTLSVTIRDGAVRYGRQTAYIAQAGDKVEENRLVRVLIRDGTAVGALGGKGKVTLLPFDNVTKGTLDAGALQDPMSFRLISGIDAAYKAGLAPRNVYRKTHPDDIGRTGPWDFSSSSIHVLYLRLPHPLTEGSTYTLSFPGLPLKPYRFAMKSDHLVSEAIHVSQIGFRPDDPAKVAFVSCWMGDGGGILYPVGMPFRVVDADTGVTVYKGTLALSKAKDDLTEDLFKRNYNGTNVYIADFSAVERHGRYVIVLAGVGCSRAFRIAPDVWYAPFRASVRGLYHQRSGIALGPPYTSYIKPRDFHPDDGLKVYASTTGLIDTKNGPAAYDVEPTNFGNLNKGRTDVVVPDVWGGYHDAGDWDRRIQHLLATRNLLDLVGMFPSFARKVNLSIPESGGEIPDMLDEALYGLDVYRRLQTKEGGVRGGIESEEHPRHGEASWQESLTVMTYAPDSWSTYMYVCTAARASRVLGKYNPGLALEYRKSALRAMEWAEKQPLPPIDPRPADGAPAPDPAPSTNSQKSHLIRDARNLASAELFRLTGDTRWNDVFRATTMLNRPDAVLSQWLSHDQTDAAWVYARTETTGVDVQLRDYCKASIVRAADDRLASCESTGFHWTTYPWRFFGIGVPAVPDAASLIWAHCLTGDSKYLRGIVLAAQFGAGANPLNMTFTTGVGQKCPRNPLHLDSRTSGQPAPPGITILGPMDATGWYSKLDWGRSLIEPNCYPALETWPPIETYMDVYWNSIMCEFTIHDTIAPNFLCWGYLAARHPNRADHF